MGLLDVNPVAWFESAANGKLERDVAAKVIGSAYSSYLSFLWGMRTVPMMGKAFGNAAMATYLNLIRTGLSKDHLALTVPDSMNDPDAQANYATTMGR